MSATRRGEGGFTLIEIMVSMALLVIGLLGILALQMTTVKGNRVSRELDRARVIATQLMEDMRSRKIDTLTGGSEPAVTTPDDVTYRRDWTVAAVAGSANLRLVTVVVTFAENDDPDDEHTATLQMLRTVKEKL